MITTMDMNPCAPLNPNKWAVTFEGGFWGHEGSVCEEIKINNPFAWDKEKWGITSIYTCDEGLVVDYCIEVDLDKLNSFLDKWNLRGGEYVEYSNMEQETIQNEHPMNICFQSKLICNGKMLETRSGSSISWVPASCNVDEFFPDMETRLAMKHYELDENKAWVLWRNSYKWEEREETIESVEIRLNRDAKKYIGKSIGNPSQGAEVEIENPATGQKYKMTVQDVSDEEYDSSLFNNPNMEYPTYFKTMTYSIEPDIDSMSFTFQDACEADHPRMKEQDENGTVAMCVSVIGGNRGMVGINMRNTRAVCSSLHFEKEYEVEWVPIFLVKEMEDKVVSIKKSIL